MPNFKRNETDRIAGESFQSKKGYVVADKFTAPLAANATSMLNAQSLAAGGTVTIFVAQPDVARQLQLVASGATTANVTINGLDKRGNALSEVIALAGAVPVFTLNAFASVSSIVLPTVAATTLNVGISAALGLSRRLLNGDAGAYLSGSANKVYETTRATVVGDAAAVAKNLVTTNTAPNASRNFVFYYISDEITAQV